jgi:hypothetical protein
MHEHKPPKGSKKGLKCEVKYCRQQKAKNGDGYYQSVCNKHKSRQLKERHPETYVLNMIRNRARKKKIPFSLTLEEFRKFCAETNCLANRGKEPHCDSIDRINHDEGYHIWNIQVKPFLENSTNGHTVPGKVLPQNARGPYCCQATAENPF